MQEPFFSGQNKYENIRKIGCGTTSEVFLVRDLTDGRKYAMKVGEDKELLKRESELLKNLFHPMLPVWKDYFENKKSCLVMEYIEGITLQTWLEKYGRASEIMACNIISELLGLLQFFHSQSQPIIYRDLKATNIMIDKSGFVRVIDLGGAVKSHFMVGTYGYAAPEQFWEGIEPGPECDIYAAGKLLAFLLTGKDPSIPPYDMLKFCEKDAKISQRMYDVIGRSISVNSLGRYASAQEFRNALHTALGGKGVKRPRSGRKKETIEYEKCVWRSEYQRIIIEPLY